MFTSTRIFWLSVPFVVATSLAQAQTYTYDVKTMNFDLWCQEQAKLPATRCDKRLPEDEAQFNEFRSKIEKYEISHLQDKDREATFDSRVLHNDPIDEPPDMRNAKPVPSSKNNP